MTSLCAIFLRAIRAFRPWIASSTSHRVEVLEGLKPGDRVIVSSYSAYQNIDRVELKYK